MVEMLPHTNGMGEATIGMGAHTVDMGEAAVDMLPHTIGKLVPAVANNMTLCR